MIGKTWAIEKYTMKNILLKICDETMRGSDNQTLAIFVPICEILAFRFSGFKLTRIRDSEAELSDEGIHDLSRFESRQKFHFPH